MQLKLVDICLCIFVYLILHTTKGGTSQNVSWSQTIIYVFEYVAVQNFTRDAFVWSRDQQRVKQYIRKALSDRFFQPTPHRKRV